MYASVDDLHTANGLKIVHIPNKLYFFYLTLYLSHSRTKITKTYAHTLSVSSLAAYRKRGGR